MALSGSFTAADTAVRSFILAPLPTTATAKSTGLSRSTSGPTASLVRISVTCSDCGIGSFVQPCTAPSEAESFARRPETTSDPGSGTGDSIRGLSRDRRGRRPGVRRCRRLGRRPSAARADGAQHPHEHGTERDIPRHEAAQHTRANLSI